MRDMHIAIAGGSGFLGRALEAVLRQQGHQVAALTRHRKPERPQDIEWTPDGNAGDWAQRLSGVDAVVNLAGEGMADARWTAARKAELLESRLKATTSLVKAVQTVANGPRVFVSGSGVGYYGPHGDERITEESPAGDDFVATMAAQWEAAAAPIAAQARLVLLRTGLVLGAEGALAKMLLPFKLGIGGKLGTGEQWMPWVHVADWAALTAMLITNPQAQGPVNLCAPEPVTNADFTRALGRALHRPTLFTAPAVGLKMVLGEMAEMLLTGQRAVPARAQALGYQFRFPTLDGALMDLL